LYRQCWTAKIVRAPRFQTEHASSRSSSTVKAIAWLEFIEEAKSFDGIGKGRRQTILTDRQIHNNHQSQETNFQSHFSAYKADLSRRPYLHFKEGGLMRRVVLLTCIGITLMSVTGCAKWKQKHYYRSAYTEGDACGCGVSPAYDNVAPAPTSGIISAPAKVLPAPQF
jgi:hypothetical protein